jgi:catechol 2,3-dioxygenase-like lactoylglutathione lyase family enzyme
MAESTTQAQVTGLIAMAHVANVQRSVDFYKLLGMELLGSLKASDSSELRWAHVACEEAHLMLARASGPIISGDQAVLFYLYSPNLIALREHLIAAGVSVSLITYPEYMPKGEVRLEDPDGYVLLIGQAG